MSTDFESIHTEEAALTAEFGVAHRGARLVARSMRAFPIPHAVGIFAGNVFAFAVVGFTVVIGQITDEIIIPGLENDGVTVRHIIFGVVAVAIVGIIRGVSVMIRRYFNMIAVLRSQRMWRLSVTDRYLDAPRSYHWSRPTGELMAHADADVEAAMSMLMPLAFAVSVISLIVVSLVSLLFIHPLFVLVAILLFPALAFLSRSYVLAVEEPAARAQAVVGKVSTIAHESIDGIMVVKTIGLQDSEVSRFSKAAAELRQQRLEVGRRQALFTPILYSLPNLGILILLLIGAWLVKRDAITIGEIVQAMALFNILTMPVQILGYLFQQMPRSVVAMDRLDRVMQVKPETSSSCQLETCESPNIAFDRVSFGYPQVKTSSRQLVLSGLSVKIRFGEFVTVVGATGSGKSTMVLLLTGIVLPELGEITLGEAQTKDLGADGVSSLVAPVFQESFLFHETIRENLTLGKIVSDSEIQLALYQAAADQFVDQFPQGIDTVVGERGVTLSGGQRQRIAIARALLNNPKILVLDDATSSVDPIIEAEILDNFQTQKNKTILIVSHRLAVIRRADRVLFLNNGRIEADGTHEELLNFSNYANLIQAYNQVET